MNIVQWLYNVRLVQVLAVPLAHKVVTHNLALVLVLGQAAAQSVPAAIAVPEVRAATPLTAGQPVPSFQSFLVCSPKLRL